MDVKSHPCESIKRHCSAGVGPDRLEKGVAWVDLLYERGFGHDDDRRRFERAIHERIRNIGEGDI